MKYPAKKPQPYQAKKRPPLYHNRKYYRRMMWLTRRTFKRLFRNKISTKIFGGLSAFLITTSILLFNDGVFEMSAEILECVLGYTLIGGLYFYFKGTQEGYG